jgi:hypothetical protein
MSQSLAPGPELYTHACVCGVRTYVWTFAGLQTDINMCYAMLWCVVCNAVETDQCVLPFPILTLQLLTRELL